MNFKEEVKFFLSNSQVLIAPYYFDGVHASKIYTEDSEMLSKGTVNEIIRALCLHFGATLEGRLEASRKLLDITKNPPIIISERLGIVGMQVPCFEYHEPAWVFDLKFKIDSYHSYSELVFNKNLKLQVSLSENSIRERRYKALNLLYHIRPIHK